MAALKSTTPEASPDLEKQALLADKSQQPQTFGAIENPGKKTPIGLHHHDEWDSTAYDISLMTSWQAFRMVQGSAWDNMYIWKTMFWAVVLSFSVAFATYQWRGALLIKEEKIEKLGTFLNVFVGMLLGFFLASSMTRWHGCVNAFMELLDAVRSMHMQMTALGVDRHRAVTLSRYGILSAWLLHLSLNPGNKERQLSQQKKMWSWLEQIRPHLVLPEEKKLLLKHKECYALVWTWVASLIGRMSQDGEIPPMASPTYGRIINIVEMAYGSIRDVRTMNLVKAPFVYVHTLSILVLVNTILNAISFGIVLGMTLEVATGKDDGKHSKDLSKFVISLLMEFFISMVVPFLYLALLDVCVCISQPFTFEDSKIPSLQFIRSLEQDIANATVMGDNTEWLKPRFKK